MKEKYYLVEVDVVGSWVETYEVKATSEEDALENWSEQGEYKESYNFNADDFTPYEVYEN